MMGAYIYFKTENVKDADLADDILHEIEENKFLLEHGQGVVISCKKDLEWAKKEREDMIPFLMKEQGKGNFKVSSMEIIEDDLTLSTDEILERLTVIFEKLNAHVAMKYNYRSCAFSGDYFTESQITRITDNGTLFSNRE